LLFAKSVDAFTQLGVRVIESRFGLWGGSGEWAERRGFRKVDEVGVLYGLEVDSWNKGGDISVKEFDPSIDLEAVVEYFSSQYNLPEDDVRAFTLRLHSSENTLEYYVVRESDRLLASGALVVNPNVPSLGLLNAVHDEGVEYLGSLVSAMVNRARWREIEHLLMFFTHLRPEDPLMDKFSSLGFRYIGSNTVYEKEL
jgi:hypothetical protein